MAEMAMWALESGVRRIALRGDHQLDFWIGNILDQNFFLSVLKLKRSDLFLSTTFTAQRRVKAAIGLGLGLGSGVGLGVNVATPETSLASTLTPLLRDGHERDLALCVTPTLILTQA